MKKKTTSPNLRACMCALFLQIKSVRAPVSTLYSLLRMCQSANYRILSGLHEFLFPVR